MKHIGKFTITGMLGKGGMGKVLKVAYPVTGKVAALKILSPTPLLDRMVGRKRLERIFTQEAVTLARIHHPHVVDILDFDYHDGRPFYLMDFHSDNLAGVIGEGHGNEPSRPMGIETTVRYMTQALQGLACLHFSGIVHRDMKPANLLLTLSDRIKISDFGLSKLRGETLTHQDQVRIGSPYYAAPEQEADPDRVDARADLYAMGMTLFRLLTGTLPEGKAPAASSLNPDLDAHWDAFLAQAMAPKPRDRFQTAPEMEQALTALARDWARRKENICTAPELFEDAPPKPEPLLHTPSPVPRKISKDQARNELALDELLRPRQHGPHPAIALSDHRILTPATGLVWERGGTPFPLSWARAKAHVQALNLSRPGQGWHLPTLAELVTLLVPVPRGTDHCLPPIWDSVQTPLWSADRCSFASAWYVNLTMGFAQANDMSARYYVKAVRPARAEELARAATDQTNFKG